MKEALITILRDKNTSLEAFRHAADELAGVLAIEASASIPKTAIQVETPLGMTKGTAFNKEILLIPILRSGLVLLNPFLHFYPAASVGFVGAARDEATAKAHLYYTHLPKFKEEHVIFILDPMIATGGSACLCFSLLKNLGAKESQIHLVSYIAAPEGIAHIHKEYPQITLHIAKIDDGLDANKWIVPGLGDFGDRYYGQGQ